MQTSLLPAQRLSQSLLLIGASAVIVQLASACGSGSDDHGGSPDAAGAAQQGPGGASGSGGRLDSSGTTAGSGGTGGSISDGGTGPTGGGNGGVSSGGFGGRGGAAGTSGGASFGGKSGVAGAGGSAGSAPTSDCKTPPPASALVGWATQSGMGVTTTTGGGDAAPQTVTTLAAFTSAVSGTAAKVIYVTGKLAAGKVNVGSNKTIVGLCGAELHGHLGFSGSSNVIVRNIKMVGYGVGDCSLDPDYDKAVGCSSGNDAITVNNSSHHLWFDHCDVSDARTAISTSPKARTSLPCRGPSFIIRHARIRKVMIRRATRVTVFRI